jgi:tetratricopeptide (TPR) repeat protein
VQPAAYEPFVATTLNNLGSVLYDLRPLAEARQVYDEALAIYRRLAAVQPAAYEPFVAGTLNNLGAVLRELRALAEARQTFEEALAIYRRLAAVQPGPHEPYVATTLSNLGILWIALDSPDRARDYFREAVTLHERHGQWFESARVHTRWGQLEEEDDHDDRAIPLYETAVAHCDRGMSLLSERLHRDLFKERIERAYLRLIDHYSERSLGDHAGSATEDLIKLIGLLESLRQVETVAGLGTMVDVGLSSWREELDELLAGRGRLAERLRRDRAALLWVHAVPPNTLVFVTLEPGRCIVERAEIEVVERFWQLFQDVELAIVAYRSLSAVPQDRPPSRAAIEAERLSRSAVAAHLPTRGAEVFERFPSSVKDLLARDDVDNVFLAPCEETINLPFELLQAPGEYESPLGLKMLMPRVQGLAQLVQVLDRHPERTRSPRALVVGNPLHHGFPHRGSPCAVCRDCPCGVCGSQDHCGLPSLEQAERVAGVLDDWLTRAGYTPRLLSRDAATSAAVLSSLKLKESDVRLWLNLAHGIRQDAERGEGIELLALAGADVLDPRQVARLTMHSGIVHNQCCHLGTARGRGGGRFDGHTTAALVAGASCVLSSAHPLWDDAAAEFSARLYHRLLFDRQTVAEALMTARREMAQAWSGNPLVWATTAVWGNPWVTLV